MTPSRSLALTLAPIDCSTRTDALQPARAAESNMCAEGSRPSMFMRESSMLLLHSMGADVHAMSQKGRTPLHYAAEAGKEGCISILLSFGADVSTQDHFGRTPLQIAAQSNHASCVRVLHACRWRHQRRGPICLASGKEVSCCCDSKLL